MSAHSSINSVTAEYDMDPGMRVVLYGLASLLGVTGLGFGAFHIAGLGIIEPTSPEDYSIAVILTSIFLIGSSLFVVYGIRRTHLTLSESGIEYRTLGYRANVAWREVDRIGLVKTDRGVYEGLILRKPGVVRQGWAANFFSMSSHLEAIPLTSFESRWKQGRLGQDLKQYAPHLFT